MAVGDVIVNSLRIGALDLTNVYECQYLGFDVFEDIFNPYGPAGEILVNDFSDALGRYNITGKEDVSISFSLADEGSSCDFDLVCYENKDLDNDSTSGNAKHAKQYLIRCISPEFMTAQSRANVQKSYNTKVSSAIEDLVKKTGFESNKGFQVKDPTKGNLRYIATGHPISIFQKLNNRAVSERHKSSAYVLFVSDNNYIYSTFEQLMEESPTVFLRQSSTLGAGSTYFEKKNSIIDIKVNSSFFTPTRAKLDTKLTAYDPVTGKAVYPKKKPESKSFVHLGSPYSESITDLISNFLPSAMTQHDRVNNKTPTGIAAAKQNREAYISDLSQNYAELTVPGNPDIKLGNVINIELYNKSTIPQGDEKQFNGPVLVTAIRHSIQPFVNPPAYKMRLRVIKAGGFDQGG